MRKNQSVFLEYFECSPYLRLLDFLIQGQEFDYSMTEAAGGAGVGWSAFTNGWKKLVDKGIIIQTREIGNAKLFKLNKENVFVKKIIKLDWELTKAETEKLLSKKLVEAR